MAMNPFSALAYLANSVGNPDYDSVLRSRFLEQEQTQDERRKKTALANLVQQMQPQGAVPTQPGVMGPLQPRPSMDTESALIKFAQEAQTPEAFQSLLNYRMGQEERQRNQPLRDLEMRLKEAQIKSELRGPQSADPSSVREWQYYNALSPDDQTRYLNMKRGMLDKGVVIDEDGNATVIGGYGDAAGSIEGAKAGASQQAEKDVDAKMNPKIAAATVAAEMEARGDIPEREKKEREQARVTGNLQAIRDQYLALQEKGGIVDTDKGALENLGAAAKSSGAGQFVGRVTGAEEQSIRDQINMIRPTLVNDVRQAAEMGAKGMDSEKELEFFLQAVSDPKKSIQANLAALAVLDRAYGLGKGLDGLNLDQEIKQLKSEFQGQSSSKAIPYTEYFK